MISLIDDLKNAWGYLVATGHGSVAVLAVTTIIVAWSLTAIALWALYRVRMLALALPTIDRRIDSISNSMALLTDTTESCFKAISMQLQFMQSQQGIKTPRRTRTEPPVGSTSRQSTDVATRRRADAMARIASRDSASEGEAALRRHLEGSTRLVSKPEQEFDLALNAS